MTVPAPPADHKAQPRGSMLTYTSNDDVLKAEIIWTLHTIAAHTSFKSNEEVGKILQAMFPDSAIAAKFTCGEKKTSYVCVFGLAEHFSRLLKDDVSGCFSVLFDESLNKKTQEQQMDIHVRYWKNKEVVSRYFGSEFLGHATADDMLNHFSSGVIESGLAIKNMAQISMDGPNVNWKFYSMVKKKLSDEFDSGLINIGSCGLHIIHNSFKAGAVATGWDVSSLLSSLYRLFKDSPARREDFANVSSSGSSLMPLKFCNHRWLENVPVCERALQIWDRIEAFVKAVKEKAIKNPANKSFATVKEATEDKLIKCKIQVFQCIAGNLLPFLTLYQTDKPMVCFLASDLIIVIRVLMRKFIKDDVLYQASTEEKLVKIDVEDNKNHKAYKQIDLGFSAERSLREALRKGDISQKQAMELRIDCKTFLITTLKKILFKCPISYALVRNMTALDPREMAKHPTECRTKMKGVMSALVSAGKVKEKDCDSILQEFDTFLEKVPVIGSDKFTGFDPKVHRVDQFFATHMSCEAYNKLFAVVKLLLVLSHGQASVERGFSVNKETSVDNISPRTVIAKRVVCDHINAVGGVLKVALTKELLQSASLSRRKYEQHLQDEKRKKTSEEQQRKRKHMQNEVDMLKHQQKRMKLDIDALNASADSYSEKAETTGDISQVTKANALRRAAKEKSKKLVEVEENLCEKEKSLKQK